MLWFLRYSLGGNEWGPFTDEERAEMESVKRAGSAMFWRAVPEWWKK